MRGISREVLARDAAWSLADGSCKDLTIEWGRWETRMPPLSPPRLASPPWPSQPQSAPPAPSPQSAPTSPSSPATPASPPARATATAGPTLLVPVRRENGGMTPTLARDREVTPRISCRTTGPGGRAHHPQTRHDRGPAGVVAPRPGESIESWLEHLADANGLTTAQLLTSPAVGAGTRYLTLAPSPRRRSPGSRPSPASTNGCVCRHPRRLRRHRPRPHRPRPGRPALLPAGRRPRLGTRPRHPDLPGLPRRHRCLAERVAAPHRHHLHPPPEPARRRCPSCQRPFRDQRHSHLRRVGAATVCGNPLGAGPHKQCQHDLTTIPDPAATDVLAMQAASTPPSAEHQVPCSGRPPSRGLPEPTCGT
jgi:hypothetical protein